MKQDIKLQDVERIINDHRFGELLPESQIVDSKDYLSYDQEAPYLRGVPVNDFPIIPTRRFDPPGTSTPDNNRSRMRAPLSGSTVSGDGTGDGSHDGSTRDGDSDEARPFSGRATGLRSARQSNKRKIPDEFDDLSEEDEGSPSGRNKRVQANRLSAQRSRQRKLEKEAELRREVERLDKQIAGLKAEQHRLVSVESELSKQIQAKGEIRPALETRNAHLEAKIISLRANCSEIMDANPQLSRMEYSCR